MPAVAWVTVIIGALIVAAAALGLARVLLHLVAIHRSLDGVLVGVGAVADRTATVPDVVPAVNASLQPVRDFCESV
jgi:hypothetical protein